MRRFDLPIAWRPEHLSIPDANKKLVEKLSEAGSVFLGPWSAQPIGDYASGTNHVLPTSGWARARGGLSVADFVKCSSTQEISRAGLKRLAPVVTAMARAEGLEAHARAVEVRRVKRAKLPTIPIRKAVLGLAPYNAPEEGRAGKLRLDFNENTVGCSPAVLRALSRMTAEEMAIYPEYQETTKRLARFFGVRPAEMHLTNGIDDALHLIADTFIEDGDSVLVVEPTFDMYRFFAELAGARVIALRYDDEMRFPVDAVVRALRQPQKRCPRVLYIANPNNPTGTLVQREELRRILRAASRTLVLVDEAYFDFSGLTILPWIRRYPNLLVARTFSKSAGLAALRIGCLFGKPEILAAMRRACTPYPVNSAALVAAEAAIRDPRFLRDYTREVLQSRAHARKGPGPPGRADLSEQREFRARGFRPGGAPPGARPRTEGNSGARAAGIFRAKVLFASAPARGPTRAKCCEPWKESCEAGAQTHHF